MNLKAPNHIQLQQIVHHPERPLASLAAIAFGHGRITQEHYLGHRYIDPNDPTAHLPTERNTKYRVASISKLVTTIGAMQLVEAGKLDLAQDISDYFGYPICNPHHPQIPITTRMLLNHTSSIRDNGDRYIVPLPYTVQDILAPKNGLYSESENENAHWGAPTELPNHFFCYANLNFGLVGTLIEIISGQRFDEYMTQCVFGPLGIDANFNVSMLSDEGLQNLAVLYRRGEQGVWQPQVDDYRGHRPAAIVPLTHDIEGVSLTDYLIGTNGTLFSPQGGLRISAYDLATLGMMLVNGGKYRGVRLLQPSSVEQMLMPTWTYDSIRRNGNSYGGLMRCWGQGVHLITSTGGAGNGDCLIPGQLLQWAGHAGDAYGLHSGLWFDPVEKRGLVYCIGGIGTDPAQYPGRYSSFYRWEEEIMTALLRI